MNWKLIFALSLFGLAIGLPSLFGLGSIAPLLWLIVFTICAWVIATGAPGKYFLHGFLAGVVSSVWFTLVHAYYLFDLSRNKPEMVEILPQGVSPQVMNLLVGLITAAVAGLIGGFFAFVAAKILKQGDARESESIR